MPTRQALDLPTASPVLFQAPLVSIIFLGCAFPVSSLEGNVACSWLLIFFHYLLRNLLHMDLCFCMGTVLFGEVSR